MTGAKRVAKLLGAVLREGAFVRQVWLEGSSFEGAIDEVVAASRRGLRERSPRYRPHQPHPLLAA